jgi:hypothetical protein
VVQVDAEQDRRLGIRRTREGRKRAPALVAVSGLLKTAATNVLFPHLNI